MKPLLIERNQLGAGSTARCAGGVRQQFSTAVNVKVGMLSLQLLERFDDETGQSADLRQIGYLFLASTSQAAEQLKRNFEVQRNAGLDDVRWLSVDEALELFPDMRGDDLTAATFCPSDGLAGPNEVVSGYAAAARRHGAVIVEGTAVDAILRDGDRVLGVSAGGEHIDTPLVINCAGPYAGQVGEMAKVDVPVKPYRRHIFLTERFELRRRPPMTVDFATSLYLHPEGDGLLLGMSDPDDVSSFDTSVSWDSLEHMLQHAAWRLPALEAARIRTGWAGLYEVSPDHQAIVGESPDLAGFWLCCGFSGHGFMQAPAIGQLLADVMLGRTPEIDIAPFAPDRFGHGETEAELAVI